MTPDRCGTGRSLNDLPPGDRAVAEFATFLADGLAYDPDSRRFVPLGTAGAQTASDMIEETT